MTTKILIFLIPKNGYFSKGFTHGLVKKYTIFFSVFFSKIGLEIMFSYGLERKEAFDTINMWIFECPKVGYLPKGLTHGLSQKVQNFL